MKRIALLLLLLIAFGAEARIGGGDSYSDSSSSDSSSDSSYSSSDDSSDYDSSSSSGSSSSGSADPGAIFALMFFMFIMFVGAVANATRTPSARVLTVAPTRPAPVSIESLRQFDPNFSEIVFTDFCYSLFARVYEALGRGRVDDFAPYVGAAVREGLKTHAPQGLSSIDGVVIGSFTIIGVRGLDTPHVEADVEFEANYTEVAAGVSRRFYVREAWTLIRARDLLSPAPEKARAEHCPKCGAALQTRTDGACLHCGSVITDGSFNWYVKSIQAQRKDEQPPKLGGGSGADEPGLDRATIMQPWIGRHLKTFEERHLGFTWEGFEQRVRFVATELQNALTARDWSRARPLETDALFQMHRYWIDEYLRQDVRNIVTGYAIDKVDVVKVTGDAFYDAITVRLYASGADHTVNAAGDVIGGTSLRKRSWSEYWTFVRGRAGGAASRVCPNCGAARAEGQAAICEYCGGKITTGDFPWVLSRIEQDEAYRG